MMKIKFHPGRISVCSFLILIMTLGSCLSPLDKRDFYPISEMYARNIYDQLFDSNWKFHKGEIDGVEMPDFDDSQWRRLDVPHDWSIEDLDLEAGAFPDVDPQPEGPFSPDSPGDISTGFVLGGTGWYRKHFSIDPKDDGKIFSVTFDGVYMNADFWINGHHLGHHPYGYTAFSFDITPYLFPEGKDNVLAVKVKNVGRNSRWYSGSGIYRHVWMTAADPLHMDRNGVYITTSDIQPFQAKVQVETNIRNYYDHDREFKIVIKITDPEGNDAGSLRSESLYLGGGKTGTFAFPLIITNPLLWSTEDPYIYLAGIHILEDGKIKDRLSSTFGIRSIDFTVEKGFQLNGQSLLLKGGNMHHDNGPLGSAAIDRAEYRRVELMKSFGYNAIRTSHNPPSNQFLDACDKLGMLVIDESFDQWQRPKNPEDYNLYFDEWWERDIESMVLRDRNHPSVIIWSIGNEINERADSSGLILTELLKNKVRALDPTRPVTAAICGFWEFPGRPWEDTKPAFELLDVAGYNYQWERYETDHELFPERIILGTESVAEEAYDNWHLVKKYPWVLGDFLWTGMDYLGEAAIGNALAEGEEKTWPWFNANCGDIDLCGFKKPQSYYRDVVWEQSVLEMAVHTPLPPGSNEIVSFWGWPSEEQSWNWKGHEGEPMEVSIYSSCDSVVLDLNGKSCGVVRYSDSMQYKAKMNVHYESGTLKTIGYLGGKIVKERSLSTTGDPFAIRMHADRELIQNDRNDLSYITVEIVDEDGNRIPDAEVNINFEITGAGELAGVGNGNPKDIKSFQSPVCKTFRGRCLLIVRPYGDRTGEIMTSASADRLKGTTIYVGVRD